MLLWWNGRKGGRGNGEGESEKEGKTACTHKPALWKILVIIIKNEKQITGQRPHPLESDW